MIWSNLSLRLVRGLVLERGSRGYLLMTLLTEVLLDSACRCRGRVECNARIIGRERRLARIR